MEITGNLPAPQAEAGIHLEEPFQEMAPSPEQVHNTLVPCYSL